jgi:hypothetical protein
MEKSAARIHHPNSGNNYGVQNRFAADYVVIDRAARAVLRDAWAVFFVFTSSQRK